MSRPRRTFLRNMNTVLPDFKHENLIDDIETNSTLFDGRFGRQISNHDEALVQMVIAAFDNGALERLPPRERECFIDVMVSGDSEENVAKRYRITRRSVRSYVERAALKLRGECHE